MPKVLLFALRSGITVALLLAVLIFVMFAIASLVGTDVNVLLATAKAGGVGFVLGFLIGLYAAGTVYSDSDQ